MTRDLSYYFEKDYDSVFNAFFRAATEKFGSNCKTEEGKIISFGLNFSFRYNMNGGALRVFFMRRGTGTAVNLHYIIAQLYGARYGAHAKALLGEVESRLGVRAIEKQIPLASFQAYQHSETPAQATAAATPAQASATVSPVRVPSTAIPAVQKTASEGVGRKICPNCKTSLSVDSRFCTNCGTALPTKKFCSSCGKPVEDGAKFCTNCGAKL